MSKTHKKGFGALSDTRPVSEQNKDFRFEETVSSIAPVVWTVKKDWRKFPIFDQNGSGSCVAQTVAKMMGIMYWLVNKVYVHFSATHVYKRRSNKPQAGMIGENACQIAMEGVTLEELTPSQSMTDKQMDSVVIEKYKEDVGKIFGIKNYLKVDAGDIEKVASIIQTTRKPLMVWFYMDVPEWTTFPYIKNNYSSPDVAPARHSVTAVDFTLLGKEHTSDKTLWGKKAIIIDDSWGSKYGQKGQRFITEDFFKKRNYFVRYFMSFKFEDKEPINVVIPKFNYEIFFNPQAPVVYGNASVITLQNFLRSVGYFPLNVNSTGYFGAITSKHLGMYQKDNGLIVTGNLDQQTINFINKL